MLESVAKQVLAEYGIPVSREAIADSAEAAVAAARELGGPVALKVLSYGLSQLPVGEPGLGAFSGDATVYTFTLCHRGPGAFNAEVPYVIALGEQPRHCLVSRRGHLHVALGHPGLSG